MAYLSEITACRWIKDPVKMYIDTSAADEFAHLARAFCEDVTRGLQKEHRAYLGASSAFSGDDITYANQNPDKALVAHEEWHKHLEELKLTSDEGDFIEEATAMVIESITGGYRGRYRDLSDKFIQTQLLVQNSSIDDLEKILSRFAQNIVPSWDEKVMIGSCPWLRFIEDAKYLLLYDLCDDICSNSGMRGAKRIYETALKKTKAKGNIKYGLKHLRANASETISENYNFNFDIGKYFPSYPEIACYIFFEGKLKIEVYGAYKTWMQPVEREIRKRKFK